MEDETQKWVSVTVPVLMENDIPVEATLKFFFLKFKNLAFNAALALEKLQVTYKIFVSHM